MRSTKSRLFAGLLVAAALAAGCGGGDELSDDEYRQEVEGVLTPLGEELTSIGTETSNQTTPEGVADGLGQAEDALETSVTDLEAIEPPSDLQEPHDRMVGAIDTFEQETQAARKGAEEGDLQAVATDYVTAATEFQSELTEVVQDFQDAGLDIQQPTE